MVDSTQLEHVIRELDAHVAEFGWDQSVQLFAILNEPSEPTMELPEIPEEQHGEQLYFEPQGLDFSDNSIVDVLSKVGWNDAVQGLALVAERIISAENQNATDYETESYSTTQEIRVFSIAMRDGRTMNAIRYRIHDDPKDLLVGPNLVPELNEALLTSLISD